MMGTLIILTLCSVIAIAFRDHFVRGLFTILTLFLLWEAPMSEVTWQREPEFIGADHAERARIGDYELVVFDLPADRARPAVIGWELFGPPRHRDNFCTFFFTTAAASYGKHASRLARQIRDLLNSLQPERR